MTISKEIKIGFTFVVAAAILFFGLNFLKGINIFTPNNRYFAVYEDVGGLVISNPVNIKGYKVGQVRSIKYNFNKAAPFVVEIAINKDIKIPKGTVFYLADESLMGGKVIDIQLGTGSEYIKSGDTVKSDITANFFAQIAEYMPKLTSIIDNIDSITTKVDILVSNPNLKKGLDLFAPTMADINQTMAQLKVATASLPATMSKIDNIATNIDAKVGQFDVEAIMTKLNATLANVDNFTQKLNNKNSSLGLLINDRAVYDNLNSTIQSANSLMIDIKANPKRYVHFSVFGKKNNK